MSVPDVMLRHRVAKLESAVRLLFAVVARLGELVPGIGDDPLVLMCFDAMEGKPGAQEALDAWMAQRREDVRARETTTDSERDPK
jgi:hypothetical protein